MLTACSSKERSGKSADTEPMMIIETDYGDLLYPARWEKELLVEQKDQPDGVIVSFSTEADGTVYSLFTAYLGTEHGDCLGTVTAPDGTEQPVFIEIHDLPDLSALSPEEQDRLYGMQEGVNDVISALNH